MFSKEEASQLRQQFWTSFGKYMAPVAGAEGEKVQWINYKTGEKDVFFRMQADAKGAEIFIELTHKDESMRLIYFEQFAALKNALHDILSEEWVWEKETTHNGKTNSRIIKTLPDVSIFRKSDWPQIISFFKQRIIALDAFWSEARYYFESLH
jgi:hypothetical protein